MLETELFCSYKNGVLVNHQAHVTGTVRSDFVG